MVLTQAARVSGQQYLHTIDVVSTSGSNALIDGLEEGAYPIPRVAGTTRNHVATANSGTYQLKRGGTLDSEFDNITLRPDIQLPMQDIHTIGDSFVSSLVFEQELQNSFRARGSEFTSDGVGGSTLAQQKIRFDSTPQYYDDILVIMDGGFDDTAADAKTAIDAMVANLTHDRWVWVQPSPAENIDGSPERAAWDADVADIAAYVGVGHYVECLTALQAGNDGSPNDLQDVADNIVPRSLRSDTIHETDYGLSIRTRVVRDFILARG